jgi:hypothetical protein
LKASVCYKLVTKIVAQTEINFHSAPRRNIHPVGAT